MLPCMAPTIPISEPASITAGDSLTWRITLADYLPSDGWALSYTLISSAGVIAFASAADGDAHLVSVPATTTVGWAPGVYRWSAAAVSGADRYTLRSGTITIAPDPAQAVATDTRSHARRMLAAIEAWLESRDPGVASYTIHGRQMQYIDLADLLAIRDRYRAEVRREDAAAQGRVLNKLQVRL